MARNYSSIAGVKTLASDISSTSVEQLTLNEATDDLPSPPFILVINPDTDKEEVVLVVADQGLLTPPTYKISRGIDSSGATTHTQDDVVKHMIVGSDLQIVHDHFSNNNIETGTAHGAEGGVVGRTNTQTLTNKRLDEPKLNENVVVTATATEVNILAGATVSAAELNILDGATLSTTELNYVDGVTSAIQTQLDTNTPVGSITMWALSNPPTGWQICNGDAAATTALADVLGTANVPDLRGRVPAGFISGDNAFGTLRGTGGSKTSTATHTHSLSAHTHGDDHQHSGGTGGQTADHSHGFSFTETSNSEGDGAGRYDSSGATAQGTQNYGTGGASNDHAHYFTTNYKSQQGFGASTGGPSTDTSGGSSVGATNGNLQPYFTLNFIIKH